MDFNAIKNLLSTQMYKDWIENGKPNQDFWDYAINYNSTPYFPYSNIKAGYNGQPSIGSIIRARLLGDVHTPKPSYGNNNLIY